MMPSTAGSRRARRRIAARSQLATEAREVLRSAIARDDAAPESESLLQIATRLFGPEHGIELDLPPRSGEDSRLPPDFSGPEFDL